MRRPASLNVLTALGTAEGELDFTLRISHFGRPRIGQVWLIAPDFAVSASRVVEHIHVQSAEVEPALERGYEWAVELNALAVPTPVRWYDIVEEVDREGFPSISTGKAGGTKIVHDETIELVWRRLGFES